MRANVANGTVEWDLLEVVWNVEMRSVFHKQFYNIQRTVFVYEIIMESSVTTKILQIEICFTFFFFFWKIKNEKKKKKSYLIITNEMCCNLKKNLTMPYEVAFD